MNSQALGNSQDGVQYAISQNVEAEDGRVFDSVVSVNADVFQGYRPRDWKIPLKDFVSNYLAGKKTTVSDSTGGQSIIQFANKNEYVRKEGDSHSRSVLGKLAQKNDRNSQLAVANAVELIKTSFADSATKEHSHQWLDENGWDFRKSYMMFPNGKIYEVTLNIGLTKDGRNVLYDINKIHQVAIGKNLANDNSQRAEIANPEDMGIVTRDERNVNRNMLSTENAEFPIRKDLPQIKADPELAELPIRKDLPQSREAYETRESSGSDSAKDLKKSVKRGTIQIQNGFACFPDGDILNKYSKNVVPMDGYFDVAMHGMPTAVAFLSDKPNMSARGLARVIRHSSGYSGQKIRLLSCKTGQMNGNDYCLAEELANALGVEVMAPNRDLYIYQNGEFRVGQTGEGEFVIFTPNQRRRMK